MRVPYGTLFMHRSRQTHGMFRTEHTSDSEHGGSTAVVTPGAELFRYVTTQWSADAKDLFGMEQDSNPGPVKRNTPNSRLPSFEEIKPPLRRWRGWDVIEDVL